MRISDWSSDVCSSDLWDSTYPLTDPVTGVTTEIEYGKIPCRRTGGCNPFVPAELRGNETPSSGAGIAWGRRFDEVGGQITENKRETIRSWAGLRGKISASWKWEASRTEERRGGKGVGR